MHTHTCPQKTCDLSNTRQPSPSQQNAPKASTLHKKIYTRCQKITQSIPRLHKALHFPPPHKTSANAPQASPTSFPTSTLPSSGARSSCICRQHLDQRPTVHRTSPARKEGGTRLVILRSLGFCRCGFPSWIVHGPCGGGCTGRKCPCRAGGTVTMVSGTGKRLCLNGFRGLQFTFAWRELRFCAKSRKSSIARGLRWWYDTLAWHHSLWLLSERP